MTQLIKIKYGRYVYTIGLFWFYLIILPYLNPLIMPCLKSIPGQVYEIQSCNLNLAFNHYLLLALCGFSLIIIFMFVFKKSFVSIKNIFIIAVVLAISIIAGFYNYIPLAEKSINQAPIYIDSLLK